MKFLSLVTFAALSALALAAPAEAPGVVDTASPGEPLDLDFAAHDLESPDQGIALQHGMLHVEVGGNRQHVGGYIGPKMFDAIRGCLNLLCPDKLMYERENGRQCHREPCRVNKVVYIEKGKLADNAYFEVEVTAVEFGNVMAQRQAMMKLVADAYAIQTEDGKNCNKFKFDDGGDWIPMCNVGEILMARLSGAVGISGRLNVKVKFNGKTEGKFDYDCPAIKEATRVYLKKDICPELAKAQDMPFFDATVTCRRGITSTGM